MNLLAHAILSPSDRGILVGNLIADWVKGRARHALPDDLRAGMQLHRRIDTFTDTHPLVDHCAALLSEKWGRYSTILVDIFFDHILAADWPRHSETPLPIFAAETYATLAAYQHVLPERCNHAICAMIMDDWFTSYATLDGIRLTLTRMSVRLRHDIELAPAVDDFFHHRLAFEKAFGIFFPELRRHIAAAPLHEAVNIA
jgi:acyl carrier protein phosphodiesterase